MERISILKQRRDRLKNEICQTLDILIGTVNKSQSMTGHNITTKVEGKTVTLYVRKNIVRQAKEMTARNKKVRLLLQRLSKTNWEILKLEGQ